MINFGDDKGQIAVVVDIFDHNRVLIDGPTTGVARQMYPLKRLALTDKVVTILRGARTGTLK